MIVNVLLKNAGNIWVVVVGIVKIDCTKLWTGKYQSFKGCLPVKFRDGPNSANHWDIAAHKQAKHARSWRNLDFTPNDNNRGCKCLTRRDETSLHTVYCRKRNIVPVGPPGFFTGKKTCRALDYYYYHYPIPGILFFPL